MYPDQSLYPVSSVPDVVKRINNALRRADQIQTLSLNMGPDFMTDVIQVETSDHAKPNSSKTAFAWKSGQSFDLQPATQSANSKQAFAFATCPGNSE
jgi:hypothetical protein